MITFEELDAKVTKDLSKEGYESILEEWQKKKEGLKLHTEAYPYNWRIDEHGNEICDYEEELVGYLDTYDEELAYICWEYGCSLHTSYDWVDGSPRFSVIWPTEEEYQENLKEAAAWKKKWVE